MPFLSVKSNERPSREGVNFWASWFTTWNVPGLNVTSPSLTATETLLSSSVG